MVSPKGSSDGKIDTSPYMNMIMEDYDYNYAWYDPKHMEHYPTKGDGSGMAPLRTRSDIFRQKPGTTKRKTEDAEEGNGNMPKKKRKR